MVARNLGTHHITGPEEYFEKFHSDLGLPPSVLGDARDIWGQIKDNLAWQGKKPSGIAGVILYFASQRSDSTRTQSEVCKSFRDKRSYSKGPVENSEPDACGIVRYSTEPYHRTMAAGW